MTSQTTPRDLPSITPTTIQEVELERIDASDTTYQLRLTCQVDDVRESLAAEPQREAIDLVDGEPYRIIDGFRRARAAAELGWRTIKAIVHPLVTDEEAFRIAFTKNVVRRNLSPLEKANAMLAAQTHGFARKDLCELFGLSEKQVRRYLALLDFPEPIQKLLDGRQVTMAHAKVLAEYRVWDAERWAKRIRDEQLDTKALRRELRLELGKRKPGRKKLYLKAEESGLRFYPFTIRYAAPEEDRRKVIEVLEEALKKLRETF